jgi:hypothetical protein
MRSFVPVPYRNDDEFTRVFAPGTDHLSALLFQWRRNCLRSQLANYDAANWFGRLHQILGIPAAIIAAIVGAGAFATLNSSPSPTIGITLGLLSLSAAILVSLQTFLRLDERSSRHRATAAAYGALKREIDLLLAQEREDHEALQARSDVIRQRMDVIARDAPEMPDRIWDAVHEKVPPVPQEAVAAGSGS